MNNKEKKALALIQSGMSSEDVENELHSEFIFFRDPMTDKYTSATQWPTNNI